MDVSARAGYLKIIFAAMAAVLVTMAGVLWFGSGPGDPPAELAGNSSAAPAGPGSPTPAESAAQAPSALPQKTAATVSGSPSSRAKPSAQPSPTPPPCVPGGRISATKAGATSMRISAPDLLCRGEVLQFFLARYTLSSFSSYSLGALHRGQLTWDNRSQIVEFGFVDACDAPFVVQGNPKVIEHFSLTGNARPTFASEVYGSEHTRYAWVQLNSFLRSGCLAGRPAG